MSLFKTYKSEKYFFPCIAYAYGNCEDEECPLGYKHIEFCIHCVNDKCKYGDKCKIPKAVHVSGDYWKIDNKIGIFYRAYSLVTQKPASPTPATQKPASPTPATQTLISKLVLTELTQGAIDKNIKELVNSFNTRFGECAQNIVDTKKVKVELDKMYSGDKLLTSLIEQLTEVQKIVRLQVKEFDLIVADQEKIQSRASKITALSLTKQP